MVFFFLPLGSGIKNLLIIFADLYYTGVLFGIRLISGKKKKKEAIPEGYQPVSNRIILKDLKN